MAKTGLVIVDEDTGEVIKNPLIKLNDLFYGDTDGLKIGANVVDSEVRLRNIRIYSNEKLDTPELSDEEFGPYKFNIHIEKRFSKLFQLEDPCFSNDIYYKYWHKLCQHLDQDSNIILKDIGSKDRALIIEDLIQICGGGNRNIYRFLNECKKKNLIARIQVGISKRKYFILNPLFSLNGNKMPIILYDLFEAFSSDDE